MPPTRHVMAAADLARLVSFQEGFPKSPPNACQQSPPRGHHCVSIHRLAQMYTFLIGRAHGISLKFSKVSPTQKPWEFLQEVFST